MKKLSFFIAISLFILSCGNPVNSQNNSLEEFSSVKYTGEKIEKSEKEWKKELSAEQFKILRNSGTEAAFSSKLLKEKREGVFVCAGCGLELFNSDSKFKSGTGWPSFYKPAVKENIGYKTDKSYGMNRVEVHCAQCSGHLGHVFTDGPKPTGLRYCINGAALKFKAE